MSVSTRQPHRLVREAASRDDATGEAARRIIRRSPLGALSQPASVTPVRPLSLSERHDMAAMEARENDARLREAFLAHNGVVGGIVGGGLA